MISLICGIYKAKQMNKQQQTEAESWLRRTNRWLPESGGGEGKERER